MTGIVAGLFLVRAGTLDAGRCLRCSTSLRPCLPALGFVNFGYMQFSFVADRYQYLAGIGLIALAAAMATHLFTLVQGTCGATFCAVSPGLWCWQRWEL